MRSPPASAQMRGARRAACRGSTSRPARTSSSSVRHVRERERPDVHAVDRGHRRDVARAEALERAHVERPGPRRRAARIAVVAARRRRAASRRCSCTRRRCAAHGLGLEHVVEARHRRPDRRASRRITQATCSIASGEHQPCTRCAACERGQRGRAAVRVAGPCAPRSRRAARLGPAVRRRVRDRRRVLLEVGRGCPSRRACDLQSGHRGSPVDAPEDRIEHRRRGDHVGDVAAPAIGESACRLTNDGSRMCTRAGLEEPSERT